MSLLFDFAVANITTQGSVLKICSPCLYSYTFLSAKRRKIVDIHQDAVSVVSHAVQERLRNILERLCTCSMHRVESHKVGCKNSDLK